MTFHSIANKFLTLLFFCFAGTAAYADESKDFPEKSSVLVNDYAHFLKPEETNRLERKLVAYNDSTSTQIVIVTMTSIGEYAASDYAQQLGQRWGIGQKGKDNGLLILVVKEPHDFFIATGYGMEGNLPDGKLKRLFEEIVKPNFKQGNYYGGLDQVTDAIIQIMSGTYQEDHKGGKASGNKAIFIFIVLIILIAVFSSIAKRGGGNGGSSGGGGFLAGMLLGSLASGGFSSRGGYSGGSSSGGFGGFGGGSFGGGGAGGSW